MQPTSIRSGPEPLCCVAHTWLGAWFRKEGGDTWGFVLSSPCPVPEPRPLGHFPLGP